ncbi:rho guanine nucleotide exchange factor 11-like, partial [Heptranchias perlo]|uniref:rho guanine nucleotide exchange factor 11-like n=1 Tax=Heptranchias perlo TaxID=212740 RepID=UPI00355A04AF
LLVTEFSHMRILRVLDVVFYQPMQRDGIVATSELARIFPNLPRVIEVHATLSEAMRRLRDEGPVIREIGDILLARFDGEPGDHFREVVSGFCSSQSFGLQLIRNKQRKEQRFQYFMMEAERNRECRRLQLKDLLVSEMQRLTKYPLLLENIIKYTDDRVEREKLVVVRECCRLTLTSVNEGSEGDREQAASGRLQLDTSSLERANNPVAFEFKVCGGRFQP